MSDPILVFDNRPSEITTHGSEIAALCVHKLIWISADRASIDSFRVMPNAIDFVSDSVLAYGTTTGSLGILDYRVGSHEMYVTQNSTGNLHYISSFGNQLWAASDDDGVCLAVYDLRNLARPVAVSDLISSEVVAISRHSSGEPLVATVDGQFYRYSEEGKLVSRRMINTDEKLLATAYNPTGDYFVSLYKNQILIHNLEFSYRTIECAEKTASRIFFLNNYEQMAFVTQHAVSVQDLHCSELLSAECSNGAVSEYQDGFLCCRERGLYYYNTKQ